MEPELEPERYRIEADGLDCAVCGHDPVIVRDGNAVECPNCNESYALVVREGFALVESDGWITRVTVGPVDDLLGAVPG